MHPVIPNMHESNLVVDTIYDIEQNWHYFYTNSLKFVERKLTESGANADGVQILLAGQRTYHVWFRADHSDGKWEIVSGDYPATMATVKYAIRYGMGIPVGFSRSGKTIYWLQKVESERVEH